MKRTGKMYDDAAKQIADGAPAGSITFPGLDTGTRTGLVWLSNRLVIRLEDVVSLIDNVLMLKWKAVGVNEAEKLALKRALMLGA